MIQQQLLQLVDEPPDSTLYADMTPFDTVLLYGVKIQNAYDHVRIKIQDRYNPIRIKVNDSHFYGVKLKPNKFITQMYSRICSVPMDHQDHVDMYRKRLSMYKLSCDSCYKYLKHKIFPLDVSNLERVSINSPYDMKQSELLVTDSEQLPWFTQYTDFKIFILNNK
jgi:hypothetical protein